MSLIRNAASQALLKEKANIVGPLLSLKDELVSTVCLNGPRGQKS